jgi:hypothetical protein
MTKKIVWLLILVVVLGVGIYFIFFNKKVTTTKTTNNDSNTTTTTNNQNTQTSTVTLSDFSTSDQTVGATSTSEFTLESVSNTSKTNYHEFVFTLSSTGTDAPYVLASYMSTLGIIRVDLKGVMTDNSGIGYQKEIDINNDGVLKIYHNISSDQTEELYDIGVTKATPFKLTSTKTDNSWVITVDVQYPQSSTDTNALNVDAGTLDYGTGAQSLTGMDATEGAQIVSYAYSISDNTLQFVWSVSSDTTDPVPQATAQYDSSNNLVVTFPSLKSDKAVTSSNNIDLPGSLVLKNARNTDGSSVYAFTGLKAPADYRLHTTVSPNQVILEIKF